MNHSTTLLPPLLLIPLLLSSPASAAAAAAALEDTCRAVAAVRPDIGTGFCITYLGADSASRSADRRGLALIATRLSEANATNTAAIIQQLIDAGPGPSAAGCLSFCLEGYSDAAEHLREAASSLQSGRYGDAVTFLSAAVDAAENCEDAFDDDGMASPMAPEDKGFGRLADVALAIAATLE